MGSRGSMNKIGYMPSLALEKATGRSSSVQQSLSRIELKGGFRRTPVGRLPAFEMQVTVPLPPFTVVR